MGYLWLAQALASGEFTYFWNSGQGGSCSARAAFWKGGRGRTKAAGTGFQCPEEGFRAPPGADSVRLYWLRAQDISGKAVSPSSLIFPVIAASGRREKTDSHGSLRRGGQGAFVNVASDRLSQTSTSGIAEGGLSDGKALHTARRRITRLAEQASEAVRAVAQGRTRKRRTQVRKKCREKKHSRKSQKQSGGRIRTEEKRKRERLDE